MTALPRSLPDAAARERMRSDHDATLIVEAAAGTGKTTSVVSRVVEMVARGAAGIERIATITFTEKAGGELRLRLRQALEHRMAAERPANSVVRRRLKKGIESLEEAAIGTIHSFCATLLGEYPVEAGVDPGFSILAGPEHRTFYDRVFRRFFEAQIRDPGPGIRRLLRRPSRHQWDQPVDLLRDAGFRLIESREFTAPWRRQPWDAEREVFHLVHERGLTPKGKTAPSLVEIADLYRTVPPVPPEHRTRDSKPNWLVFSMKEAAMLEEEIRLREEAGAPDSEWTEQALATLRVQKYGSYAPPGAPPDVKESRDAFAERLAEFQKRSNAHLAALLREDLREVVDLYEETKQKAGVLDFHDLLLRTHDLLRNSPEVRGELQERYRQILVDEYQDTDPIQTEIVLLLTSDEPRDGDWRLAVPRPGRLCLVGDPKQSIYRFRGADIAHYQGVKRRLLEGGAVELNLTSNFRSVPGVCRFVNRVMEPMFDARAPLRDDPEAPPAAQVSYQPLHPVRDAIAGGPAVRAIPIESTMAKDADKEEPRQVAGFVADLLDSGLEIPDHAGKGPPRPIRPGDICLLFRRFRSAWKLIPEPFAQELHDRDIPYSLNAVRTYIGSAELTFLRAALTAVEFPEDEIAAYSTLRGPLFAFPDQDLFRFQRTHGRLEPHRAGAIELDASAPAADREIREALGFLFELHLERNERPIAVTISELTGRHHTEIGFAFWRSPEQVLTNLRRLLEEARLYEAAGGLSFRGFVAQLEAEAQAEDASAGHAVDEEGSGVRLMTIHAAKGLEFPVVVLCDVGATRGSIASRFVSREKKLWASDLGKGIRPWDLIRNQKSEIEEEKAEFDRMLYVAMTRARDILACPVARLKYQHQPAFLDPPMRRLEELASSSRQGYARATGAAPPAGRPGWRRRGDSRWRILKSPGAEDAVRQGKAAERAFRKQREKALRSGSEPARRVSGAKHLATDGEVDGLDAVAADVTAEVTAGRVSRDLERPRGAGFGSLAHRILETVRFGAPAAEVDRAARRTARELDLPEEWAAPAAAAVLAAFDHPVLEAAGRAERQGRVWRELPLLHQEEAPLPTEPPPDPASAEDSAFDSAFDAALDRSAPSPAVPEEGDAPLPSEPAEEPPPREPAAPVMVQGIADLVFQEKAGGPFTIVDFKTDAFDPDAPGDAGETLAAYRRQLALYVRAISRATKKPAQATLLFI